MNAQEQAALEALAGRVLKPEEVAKIDACLVGDRRDGPIAELLSIDRTQLVSFEITPRGSAALFPALGTLPGPLAFQKALRQLDKFAEESAGSEDELTSLLGDATKEQLAGYREKGLDFSEPALRDMLDLIVAKGGLSVDQAEGFKSLARKPAPLSTNQVSDALNKAQGLMTMGG